MFEDITKAKKEIIKSVLGYDIITKLDANVIAQKIIERHKYNTSVKLEFKFNKKKGKMIMNHNGKITEYNLLSNDTIKFTHNFDVVL